MRVTELLFASSVVVVASSGCSNRVTTRVDPTSTVQGLLATTTFASAPTGVDAVDESGARVHSSVGVNGSFRLDLAKGHHYRMAVVGPAGEEPMVFPRSNGRLDRTVKVTSGAGVVNLGNVRHLERAPEGGFAFQSHVMSASTPASSTPTSGDGEVGECVDGRLQGTSSTCVDDDTKAECENGSEASDGDGECENGRDTVTGQVCVDNDATGADEDQVDASGAMAVPEKNPPSSVGGCSEESDGEDDKDGDDSEGETKD